VSGGHTGLNDVPGPMEPDEEVQQRGIAPAAQARRRSGLP